MKCSLLLTAQNTNIWKSFLAMKTDLVKSLQMHISSINHYKCLMLRQPLNMARFFPYLCTWKWPDHAPMHADLAESLNLLHTYYCMTAITWFILWNSRTTLQYAELKTRGNCSSLSLKPTFMKNTQFILVNSGCNLSFPFACGFSKTIFCQYHLTKNWSWRNLLSFNSRNSQIYYMLIIYLTFNPHKIKQNL